MGKNTVTSEVSAPFGWARKQRIAMPAAGRHRNDWRVRVYTFGGYAGSTGDDAAVSSPAKRVNGKPRLSACSIFENEFPFPTPSSLYR
ncbi:hypothetical protein H6G33_31255 [Calothrix sp. FACHB-1219]|uniref:hypothetical protein n=1 Tax=Nostocales TaxID=1161 RepID=UPI0016843D48|nr:MULTISPECIES: hypothetical protein [Nostocales]MBD2206953.1 hypothetical protein [Calothrix sp. FACHB-168]MBD2221451.1 hypothetical protein [Calothrix sp. FACHB-1219]MBD2359572.1 hypothetical protein [Tolypothrix sp. FACHB-123]